MGKGSAITADLVVLSVPIVFACCAFSTVVFRAFAYDPEWTTGITPETDAAAQKGIVYRNQIKGFFVGGRMSVFDNEVKIKDS